MKRIITFVSILLFMGIQFSLADEYENDFAPLAVLADAASDAARAIDDMEEAFAEAQREDREAEEVSDDTELAAQDAEDADAGLVAQDAEEADAELAAQDAEEADAELAAQDAEDAVQEDKAVEIPRSIRNNRYYLESIRLAKLAQNSYEEGDYDASSEYAAEAVRYAQLSDEFVELQLKIKEANDAIAAAAQRINWASSVGAADRYPEEYGEAQAYYNASLAARREQEWDAAIEAANNVVNILAYLEAPEDGVLPAQYTVRTWLSTRDCLWNIAGRSWAYGDPFKWRMLYDANKSKMPNPANPDLIEPGMVLDIPSINDEARNGMWDPGKNY